MCQLVLAMAKYQLGESKITCLVQYEVSCVLVGCVVLPEHPALLYSPVTDTRLSFKAVTSFCVLQWPSTR